MNRTKPNCTELNSDNPNRRLSRPVDVAPRYVSTYFCTFFMSFSIFKNFLLWTQRFFAIAVCVCLCVCVCVCIFSFAIFIVTITVYMKIKTCKLSVTVFFVCLVVVFFFGFCFIMVLFYWWKKTFLHWIGVSGLHFLEALEKKFQYVPQKYKLFFKNVMKQNCTFYQRNRCVSHTNSVGRHFGNDFKSMGQMA